MPWLFGDGFDTYSATTDPYIGGTYWDSGAGSFSLVAGRFSGSRAIQNSASAQYLIKSSGANDAIHHFCVGIMQTAALAGTSSGLYIVLYDGTTPQCTIMFRSDGAILLNSGLLGTTTLATYTGAFASNTWYGFEIEVVINNTTGSFAVRKNGNTSNDFQATALNTRPGTNNYANKAVIGGGSLPSNILMDDFLWRSDPTSLPWVGDVRCYTRMPASDAAVQWTPSGAVVPMPSFPGGTNATGAFSTLSHYMPFTASCDGAVGSLSLQCASAVTANVKCSIYASSGSAPTTVLGSANVVTNPGVGTTTFTFASPVAVTRGTQYYAAFCQSAGGGTWATLSSTPPGGYLPLNNTNNYAAFPVTNPVGFSAGGNFVMTVNITPTAAVNAPFVADIQQDAANTYVASASPGARDLYTLPGIASTPSSIVAVTTRGLLQKSDAGTRLAAVQLRSGSTTVQASGALGNSAWGWLWRSDQTDPATGAAWTPTGVAGAQIGVQVTG